MKLHHRFENAEQLLSFIENGSISFTAEGKISFVKNEFTLPKQMNFDKTFFPKGEVVKLLYGLHNTGCSIAYMSGNLTNLVNFTFSDIEIDDVKCKNIKFFDMLDFETVKGFESLIYEVKNSKLHQLIEIIKY